MLYMCKCDKLQLLEHTIDNAARDTRYKKLKGTFVKQTQKDSASWMKKEDDINERKYTMPGSNLVNDWT